MEKQNYIYVLYEAIIEPIAINNGTPSQKFYLSGGRLRNMAMLTGGIEDENILNMLENCCGLRRLVHSIGVSVKKLNGNSHTIDFAMQNWGKTDIYNSGSHIVVSCDTTGKENIFGLNDIEWSQEDIEPGKFTFLFDSFGETAVASVRLFLNDGFAVPDFVPDQPIEFNLEKYRSMIADSVLSKGNNKRLKKAINKANKGEEVTIAFIGGSITQGTGAKPIYTNCYAYRSFLSFIELFSRNEQCKFRFLKAGVGGTTSELGLIRFERDILRDFSFEPDIVIVEFAVNDDTDQTKGACFESLCLKILSLKNRPALVLLFSVFADGWNLQDRLFNIGRNYDLPMISIKNAVTNQFTLLKPQGNVVTKRQFFSDIYHPSNIGHFIMADCLGYLFSEINKADEDVEDIALNVSPAIGNDFVHMRLLDRKDNIHTAKIDTGSFNAIDTNLQMSELDSELNGTPQFPNNWMHQPWSGGNSFKINIKSSSLFLVFKDSGSDKFGKADIYVDGIYTRTIDPRRNNWTHCNIAMLYNYGTSKEHIVEIKMATGNEDKYFTILGFGFTQELYSAL